MIINCAIPDPVKHSRDDRCGWVYVLDNDMGHYKIGRTASLNARMKQLHVHLPFPVSIAYCFLTDDCHRDEKALHLIFADKRLNGEWFALDLDDFGFIYEMANYSGYWETRSGEMELDPMHIYARPREDDVWPDFHIVEEESIWECAEAVEEREERERYDEYVREYEAEAHAEVAGDHYEEEDDEYAY